MGTVAADPRYRKLFIFAVPVSCLMCSRTNHQYRQGVWYDSLVFFIAIAENTVPNTLFIEKLRHENTPFIKSIRHE
jgi:hypothetical protein